MAHFRPMTRIQMKAQDAFDNDLPLLDEEFDREIDFYDDHLMALEITNQFTTHPL